MKEYDHKKIENKWQKFWDKKKFHKADDTSSKPKFYPLIEFPYPSGDGLHVGHIRSNTAMDIISRKRRAEGFNVLYPIGWDAFGLPTENYAIKTGKQPSLITKENTDTFRRQLKSLGFSFDWSREINTTDPAYYKWTQWIFLQFFKQGLAYKKKMSINWCPKDKIGLANEEVIDGKCERCGTEVEKRDKEQWMLAITKYADRLDRDLDKVDFLEKIKIQQRNWIGKSEGSEIYFKVKDSDLKIKVFTTRPDTLFGATYVVISPEHELINILKINNGDEVKKYSEEAKKKNVVERTAEGKEKTGVELKGVKAINPANGEEIPIWVADYVLSDYGTGAVMAVPAHDKRDYKFAQKFNIPIIQVVSGDEISNGAYVGSGILINSGDFSGIHSDDVKNRITESVGGKVVTTYKLRDWIFSRQRYWGEPIPLVFCEKDGWVPVPEKDLPVKLPKVKNYQPTDTGESPLSAISKWVNTKCPVCRGKARRETDTMPNWAGSSWYYLRYVDPNNKKAFADNKKLNYWTPVDWYNGGMEHTTLHLLYSRFWHKFLYDLKIVPTEEPYKKRTSHGLILAQDGSKMSKSKGNVINPDRVVEKVGADALRLYEMFMGPFDQPVTWSEDGIVGTRRFIERVYKLGEKLKIGDVGDGQSSETLLNQTIKKVSEDIEDMKFNTAVSQFMILLSSLEVSSNRRQFEIFLKILSPFAPHVTEEIWISLFKHKTSIHIEKWPVFDESKLLSQTMKIVLQVNGKVRGSVEVDRDTDPEEIKKMALSHDLVVKYLGSGPVKKVIYVQGKLINVVI